jgi:putative aminopeptidase FrvX
VKDLIKNLTETYGPSGSEEGIRELIRAQVEPLADEVRVDALGNLIALKRGSGGPHGKRVMLSAHMDEIGLMISYVDEKGFLRAQPIGGVDVMTLVGSRVQFADGATGVLSPEKRDEMKKDPALAKLYVDVGATSREEVQHRLGQAVSFVRPFADLGRRVVAKAMDDRIGCVVLIEVLRGLTRTPAKGSKDKGGRTPSLLHDVYFVFSVQEEVGLRGARTSSYGIDPEAGLAVDVTGAGDTPEANRMSMKLGGGPCIKVMDGGMLSHPGINKLLTNAAEADHIPYQMEVLPGGTTDAMAIQLARSGVPTSCISIACRYVHTPSEMVDMDDVENAVKLFLAFLSRPIDV